MPNPTKHPGFVKLLRVAALLCVAGPLAADEPVIAIPAEDALILELKSTLKVSDLSLVTITDAPLAAENAQFTLPLGKETVTMNIHPHSNRTADFTVCVVGEAGPVMTDPGPVRTVRGSVNEYPGSIVTGSVAPTGMNLRISLPTGSVYGLAAVRRYDAAAPADQYALFDLESSTEAGGTCGNESIGSSTPGGALAETESACAPVGPFVARLGCDTEEFFVRSFPGSEADQRMAAQLWIEETVNEVNALAYEMPPLSTTHQIAKIVLRTAANNIYANITDGETLVDMVQSEWRTTQAEANVSMAALWHGLNVDGSPIGRSSFRDVCAPSGCWVEKFTLGGRAIQLAHEFGHSWGSGHCNQDWGNGDVCTVCTAACPIMNSSLPHCGNPQFSQCSIDEILSARLHFTCIQDLGFVAPVVLDGETTIHNGDTVNLPEVLTGQLSEKILQVRNNQNCSLSVRVRLLNSTGQFNLLNAPVSLPPLSSVPVRLRFNAPFAGDYTARLEITIEDLPTGYEFGVTINGRAGVGQFLPRVPALLCPRESATTAQPGTQTYEWSAANYVESYQFQIINDSNEVVYNRSGIRMYNHRPDGLTVPAGRSYTWKVTAHNVNGATPAAAGFLVDPLAAFPEMHVSYRDIPVANNATLNLPLNPSTTFFDFGIRNDAAVDLLLSDLSVPEGFGAAIFTGISNQEGLGEGTTKIRPCGTATLRLRVIDPTILSGSNPIMGTIEFNTNDPASPHFIINLCFRCDPYSCVGNPFSGCGVITGATQGGCWHFVADCGTEFGLPDVGQFSIGDTVWVSGAVDPDEDFCFPYVFQPQIPLARVGICFTVSGELLQGPPCFAEPCALRLRTPAGLIYDVENAVGFQVGDRVTVTGGLIEYSSLAPSSQGLIFGNTITAYQGRWRN